MGARNTYRKTSYKVLVEIHERKILLERSKCREEYNIKTVHTDI